MKIALIVLDTLRKDTFDDHFHWLPGKRFDQAYSTSHWTVPAHASIFTGKYASEIGTHSRTISLNHKHGDVLSERLRDRGFETIGFSANPNLTRQFGFDKGFSDYQVSWRGIPFQYDVFDWKNHSLNKKKSLRYITGLYECLVGDYNTVQSLRHGYGLKKGHSDDGAKQSLSWLRKTTFEEDTFVFMNLMEAHSPYDAPESYRTVEPLSPSGLPNTIRGADIHADRAKSAYEDCVKYLSDMYRKIHSVFQENDFDLIITCSDHGELFGEHGGVWQHDYGIYPELTKIPLVISGEGVNPENGTDRLASILDIHATIEDYAGLSNTSDGKSLLQDTGHDTIFTEYHGIPLEKKYEKIRKEFNEEVLHRFDNPLFGLADARNGYFWQTQTGIQPEPVPDNVTDDLSSYATSACSHLQDTKQSTQIPEHLTDNLKDLGYL